MNEKGLLALKSRITKAERKLASLKGQRNYVLNELKEKYGCSTIKEAKQSIRSKESSARKLEQARDKACKKLERQIHEAYTTD